jgi:hypothetical protein
MNNETLDKMRQLRLYGMYDAFKTNLETSVKESLTADQFKAPGISRRYSQSERKTFLILNGAIKDWLLDSD